MRPEDIKEITPAFKKKIIEYLDAHELVHGVGNKEKACSIASINIALTGVVTDDTPGCMSPVLSTWIIEIQDAIPLKILNSKAWKKLLPLLASTGRAHEEARVDTATNWIWEKCLPSLQWMADAHGFGDQWKKMIDNKDYESISEAIEAIRDSVGQGKELPLSPDVKDNLRMGLNNLQISLSSVNPISKMNNICWTMTQLARSVYEYHGDKMLYRDDPWKRVDVVGALEKLVKVK